MANIEKKRKKIEERIKELEEEMRTNLRQKTSNTAEISVGDYQRKLMTLRTQLDKLK